MLFFIFFLYAIIIKISLTGALMNITLQPCVTNPFLDYPHFKDIWTEISSKVAQEYTAESIGKGEDGLYVIFADDVPVGITGFFDIDYPEDKFWGLRWHGIIPEYRGQGIAEMAIYITAQELQRLHPQVENLVEYIPHSDYSGYIFKFFEKLGFEALAEPETVDWTPYQLQAYGIGVQELIDNGIKKNKIPKQNFFNKLFR